MSTVARTVASSLAPLLSAAQQQHRHIVRERPAVALLGLGDQPAGQFVDRPTAPLYVPISRHTPSVPSQSSPSRPSMSPSV